LEDDHACPEESDATHNLRFNTGRVKRARGVVPVFEAEGRNDHEQARAEPDERMCPATGRALAAPAFQADDPGEQGRDDL
jgi:hypothetical protein